MDSELTELDDWVGTLEELQLGLERKCPPISSSNHLSSNSISPSPSSKASSYSGPHRLSCTPVTRSSSPWKVAQILDSPPPPALPPRRDNPISSSKQRPPPPSPPPPVFGDEDDERRKSASTLTQSIRASFNSLSCKEATAENDLNCLLRQLEEVENTMKQLELDDGGFTRRYSLASSSTTDPNTGCNPSPAPDAPEQSVSSPTLPPPLPPLSTNGYGNGNGYIGYSNGQINESTTADNQYSVDRVTQRPALPPRNLSTSARPPSPPSTDYELAEEALMTTGPSFSHVVPHDAGLSGEAQSTMKERYQHNGNGAPVERHRSLEMAPPPLPPPNQTTVMNRLSAFDSPTTSSGCSSSTSAAALHQKPPFQPSSNQNNRLGNTPPAACTSNEGSLSDKSMSECPELSKKLNQVVDLADRLKLNKLVVRIFRPDKTTKAILIDQRMTAGEVASMLIEKNFLEPSVKLCLVEKVPSLKVERVFEETETVADCILSWPVKSQNMIFFETRDDHFGFIESPKDWLGEAFANVNGFHSAESLQKMLLNFTSSGLAEWHDFLYIRKPGEKTWTRRMCVLRNSGLYASKKNKKTFSPSDLVRLLVLDDKLHIYKTTGGWSRMRAPTPHGFALKTYAAQDFSSSHVFCFCAPDETALKQWACRLRLAKYGIGLLHDYQMAKERVNSNLKGETQIPNNIIELKKVMRQSSVDCARPYTVQTPRRQASAGNLNAIKPMSTPQMGQQRIASLTPQPTTAVLRHPPFETSMNGNGYKHHSTGAPSQHFYIR
ncbi:unnamed protein product [Hymenolepis diminuta]|uniref:Ras-associating domain-containing protein n=1 Tax=Hymenolepis diminuta TaxID=6216 RepID=A0A564Z9H4_HYMDI|nr:unnamed protein product [Hymenolepis diminuta]